MSKNRILATAQQFGYGPTALLLATLDKLNAARKGKGLFSIDIVDMGSAEQLLEEGGGGYHVLPLVKGKNVMSQLQKVVKLTSYDVFLSFFDPHLVLCAWFFDKKSYYYDGLIDFWDVKKLRSEILQQYNLLCEAKKRRDFVWVSEWIREMLKVSPHIVLMVAHLLSTVSMVRKTPDVYRMLDLFPEIAKKNIHLISTLIHPDFVSGSNNAISFENKARPGEVLVTIGGSLAPVISLTQNGAYVRLIVRYLLQLQKYLDKRIFWRVLVNPAIRKRIGAEEIIAYRRNNIHIQNTVSASTFARYMHACDLVCCPPGFGTIQEAAYCRKPIVVLPEQNAGQLYLYQQFKSNGLPTDTAFTLYDQITNEKLAYQEMEVGLMYRDISRMVRLSEYGKKRADIGDTIARLLSDPEVRGMHIEKQLDSVKSISGPYYGTEQIAKILEGSIIE